MKISLREVAGAMGVPADFPEVAITGWSVDSRTIRPGDLFFALRGPSHDGHEFLADAFARGAAAAVVEDPVDTPGTTLRVQDTLQALQELAAWARRNWNGKVVAITGSAGKTTTKDLIAHLLETELPVGKTTGNLNNHVGLPLSILRLPDDCRVGVLEIGMNHAGEIRHLARIAAPDVGVVTNVGYAHVEHFLSIDEVALAKRELVEALQPSGTAVLNADDERVVRFADTHPGRTVTFGLSPEADIHAEEVECRPEGVRFRIGPSARFEAPLLGKHGVLNLLAGLATASIFEIPPERLVKAVQSFSAERMRGERLLRNGVVILNDCYNSNPEAVRSMLDVLRATPARRRIAVLGEMLELGRWSEPLHRDIGRHITRCEIHMLIGIRGAARHIIDEAVRTGMPADAAYFFEDPEDAGDHVKSLLTEGDAVLFKGSRGTHVEKALERYLM